MTNFIFPGMDAKLLWQVSQYGFCSFYTKDYKPHDYVTNIRILILLINLQIHRLASIVAKFNPMLSPYL